MIVFWICAGVLLLLGLLWLLALCAKRRKSGFFGLESYHYAHRGLHDSRQGVPESRFPLSGLPYRRATARSWTYI